MKNREPDIPTTPTVAWRIKGGLIPSGKWLLTPNFIEAIEIVAGENADLVKRAIIRVVMGDLPSEKVVLFATGRHLRDVTSGEIVATVASHIPDAEEVAQSVAGATGRAQGHHAA